jgi:hypothetical protein
VPVSLVDQLRGAANNAAADGRLFSSEDWSKVLAVSIWEREGEKTPSGRQGCKFIHWLLLVLLPYMQHFAPCCVVAPCCAVQCCFVTVLLSVAGSGWAG